MEKSVLRRAIPTEVPDPIDLFDCVLYSLCSNDTATVRCPCALKVLCRSGKVTPSATLCRRKKELLSSGVRNIVRESFLVSKDRVDPRSQWGTYKGGAYYYVSPPQAQSAASGLPLPPYSTKPSSL